jgi:hypothetical protein
LPLTLQYAKHVSNVEKLDIMPIIALTGMPIPPSSNKSRVSPREIKSRLYASVKDIKTSCMARLTMWKKRLISKTQMLCLRKMKKHRKKKLNNKSEPSHLLTNLEVKIIFKGVCFLNPKRSN